MAKKDIAFYFYPNDWLGGTVGFTRAQKGAYMDLLIFQFNNGPMSIDDVKDVLDSDFDSMWERKLKSKFSLENGKYVNKKMEDVKAKRKNYCKSRGENFKGSKKKTAKQVIHEPVVMPTKRDTIIEQYFDDLPNSQQFEQICRQLSLKPEELLTWIEPFRIKAELEYPNFVRFISHFKNYVSKELKTQNANDTRNTKTKHKSGAYNAQALSELNSAVKGSEDK